MVDVAPQKAGYRRRGEKLDIGTAVVAARQARFAGMAWDVRFNCDSVADVQRRYGGMCCDDLAGGFMTENVCIADDHGADAACMPEMDVGA